MFNTLHFLMYMLKFSPLYDNMSVSQNSVSAMPHMLHVAMAAELFQVIKHQQYLHVILMPH